MNKMKQLLTMAFLMTTIFAFGQTNTSKTEEQPYIEVTGTAEKEVTPDEIYIGIIIREKYVNKVKVTIEEQEEKLKTLFETTIEKSKADIELKALSPTDAPIVITRNEFMRRMMEMQKMGGGSPFMFGSMDEKLNLVINTNHPINGKLLEEETAQQEKHIKQLYDLALLSQNMLKGEALTNFVKRSFELI